MKKTNNFRLGMLVVALVFAMSVIGCDEGDGEPVYDNKFTINGEEHKLTYGKILYFGNYYPESPAVNIDFVLYSEKPSEDEDAAEPEIIAYFELFVPPGNFTLVNGTYNFTEVLDNMYPAFSFPYVDVNLQKFAKSGTVKVAVSGNVSNPIYTITVDCVLDCPCDEHSDGYIKGTYHGPLDWEVVDRSLW